MWQISIYDEYHSLRKSDVQKSRNGERAERLLRFRELSAMKLVCSVNTGMFIEKKGGHVIAHAYIFVCDWQTVRTRKSKIFQ
jgi:hypothetical protein